MYKERMKRTDDEKTFSEFLDFLKNENPITLDCVDEMLYESDCLLLRLLKKQNIGVLGKNRYREWKLELRRVISMVMILQ